MASEASLEATGAGSRLLALIRRQPGPIMLALMAIAGIGISIYLTIVHYDTKITLFCTTSGIVNCEQVTSSAYSVLPGTAIPITIPGMLWFIVSGALAVVALRVVTGGHAEPPRLRLTHLVWAAGGLAFVLYLVFAEIVLVQRICEWCTVIHLLTLGTFLITLTRWQRRNDPEFALETQESAAPRHHAPQQALTRRTRQSLAQRGARGH